jgi:hypothetical protein
MQGSTRLSVLVFATSWLAFAPTVNAQNQSEPRPSPTTPGPSSPSASIPDNKLDAAAAAMKSVSTVKEDYGRRIAQAPDDSEKSRLANEGGQALTKAVTDQGLSVAEYTEILQVAQNNTAVREKILQRIK